METSDFINIIEVCSKKKAEESQGSMSYPYAYGYFSSNLQLTLAALNLTPKQKKILASRAMDLLKSI